MRCVFNVRPIIKLYNQNFIDCKMFVWHSLCLHESLLVVRKFFAISFSSARRILRAVSNHKLKFINIELAFFSIKNIKVTTHSFSSWTFEVYKFCLESLQLFMSVSNWVLTFLRFISIVSYPFSDLILIFLTYK